MSTKVIGKVKLQIKDQHELLNQISGTYKDFFRAAMEYVDNAIDAATGLQRQGKKVVPKIIVEIDPVKKSVSFHDNCGGMSPEELQKLLSSVGRSTKKAVSWANGQFGFGVHAFRAFAKEALFVSHKKNHLEAMIKIDRSVNENQDVEIYETNGKHLEEPGTGVVIAKFNPHIFSKTTFLNSLVVEIERHFDDVLRAGTIRILVSEKGKKPYECRPFDYEALPGAPLKKNISMINREGKQRYIEINLKVLERQQDNRLPVLINKQRRVQTIVDLKSYKNYLRLKNETNFHYLWNNPFVVGFIEINDICSPNLTRDDLIASSEREALYEQIHSIHPQLKELIDATLNKKTKDSYRKIGSIMSECLASILKSFKLEFDQAVPSGRLGETEGQLENEGSSVPFGGDEPGGGGEGPNNEGSGGDISERGKSGVGTDSKGGGKDKNSKGSGEGASQEKIIQSSGPKIDFGNHEGADRVIDLGNSFIVNMKHPDFIARSVNAPGKIKFDVRLLNYVSQVISPLCVHRLFERKGRVPSLLEVGTNVINLSLKLEQTLYKTVLNQEIETGIS